MKCKFSFHSDVKMWLEEEKNFMEIKQVFDSTSRLVQQLNQSIQVTTILQTKVYSCITKYFI